MRAVYLMVLGWAVIIFGLLFIVWIPLGSFLFAGCSVPIYSSAPCVPTLDLIVGLVFIFIGLVMVLISTLK